MDIYHSCPCTSAGIRACITTGEVLYAFAGIRACITTGEVLHAFSCQNLYLLLLTDWINNATMYIHMKDAFEDCDGLEDYNLHLNRYFSSRPNEGDVKNGLHSGAFLDGEGTSYIGLHYLWPGFSRLAILVWTSTSIFCSQLSLAWRKPLYTQCYGTATACYIHCLHWHWPLLPWQQTHAFYNEVAITIKSLTTKLWGT